MGVNRRASPRLIALKTMIKTSKSTVQVAQIGFIWVSKVKSVQILKTQGVK
jgi:hypothetical protein